MEQNYNKISLKRLMVVFVLIAVFIIFDTICLGIVLLRKHQPKTYQKIQQNFSRLTRNAVKNKVPAANFETFMQNLQSDMMQNWNPPKIGTNARVVVLMKIKKDGSLESVEILKSSSNSEMDKAALDAVNATAPFQPLPLSFKGDNIDVNFSFNYNAKNAE